MNQQVGVQDAPAQLLPRQRDAAALAEAPASTHGLHVYSDVILLLFLSLTKTVHLFLPPR